MKKNIYFIVPFLEKSDDGYTVNDSLELYLQCTCPPEMENILSKVKSNQKRTFKLLHKQEDVLLTRRSAEKVEYFFEQNVTPANTVWELQPYILRTHRGGDLLVLKDQNKFLVFNNDVIYAFDYNLSGFEIKSTDIQSLFGATHYPFYAIDKIVLSEKELY